MEMNYLAVFKKCLGNGEIQLIITDDKKIINLEGTKQISHVVIKTKKINLKVKVS